jgi:transcriptional regulator of acetoin/glycerol metabolism
MTTIEALIKRVDAVEVKLEAHRHLLRTDEQELLELRNLLLFAINSDAIGDIKTVAGILPLEEMEKQAIMRAVFVCEGSVLKAASLLRVGKTTLYRKCKEYGMEVTRNDKRRD